MAFSLSDGTTTIDLPLDYSSGLANAQILATSRAIDGSEDSYLWSEFDKFALSVITIPSSDAGLMNDWWIDGTELTLTFDSNVYSQLVITEQPFAQLLKPYYDEYAGTIVLEAV